MQGVTDPSPSAPDPRDAPQNGTPQNGAGNGDVAAHEAPHTNGAVVTTGSTRTRTIRRRIFVVALILFLGVWAVALVYSVTAGGRSPERLTDTDAHNIATACIDAQHSLSALPQVGNHPTAAERATRVAGEDEILTTMIERMRTVRPVQSTPATALTGWLGDWQRLVTARDNYASDLRTKGASARFVEPATAGVDPIADKMNNWTLEQGTRTDVCNTGELQAEVVDGTRTYGAASKT
jgi:hypothetical protein